MHACQYGACGQCPQVRTGEGRGEIGREGCWAEERDWEFFVAALFSRRRTASWFWIGFDRGWMHSVDAGTTVPSVSSGSRVDPISRSWKRNKLLIIPPVYTSTDPSVPPPMSSSTVQRTTRTDPAPLKMRKSARNDEEVTRSCGHP